MKFQASVYVTLKSTVNDPQGHAILGALQSLGFQGVSEARAGKFLTLHLTAPNRRTAESQVDQMCRKLLANPVIEAYQFEVEPKAPRPRHGSPSTPLSGPSPSC